MEPIAIVGMAALFPGAATLEAYWRNVVGAVDAITDVPPGRWDETFYDPDRAERPDRLYCRRGGFVDDLATFEPLSYGMMPSSVAEIEPDQLLALEVATAAVADAGGPARMPDADRVGVILGRGGVLSPAQSRYVQRVTTANQVVSVLRELLPDVPEERLEAVRARFDERLGRHQPEGAIGLVPNLAASRVANRLNLRGPAYTIDAACASSLLAVDQGITELAAGRLDAVLAGGVHHVHDVSFWSVFSQLKALSRHGRIRPFDAAADGLLIGEGTGMVVLKRLADAERAGDRVYAVVRGIGTSSDGRSASMFNPASSGQVLAIRRAWEAAGLDPSAPDAVGLLEAHGTGTPTGDAAELATLAEVFGPHTGGERPVIGSVKSMIGHTMPAAGAAGLIKAVLAVHHGVLPPTLHCDTPRAELAATRFAPIAQARPWTGTGPRRAGVNAFGFGGINAHVVVEQYTPPARVTVAEPDRVLWLSAADPAQLSAVLDAGDDAVRDRGYAEAGAPARGPARLGVVGPTNQRLAAARRMVARGEPWRGGRDIWFTPRPLLGPGAGRLAFVFPGVEAEFAPRTADVAGHFGLPYREWDADDLGRHGTGLVESGRLLAEALHRMNVRPDDVAGHSIGEWTAAVVTGQMSTRGVDAFLKVFDADSVEVSGYAFAAVSAAAEAVVPMLAEYPGVVLSHDNAPQQCVVNGPAGQVQRLVEDLRARNVLCRTLPFRSAFHTPVFAEGLQSIAQAIGGVQVRPTAVPVWSGTLAAPFPADPDEVTALFTRHMVEPVRFRATVRAMYDAGVRVFLQVGAGQLASLIDDNLRDREHLAVAVNVSHRPGMDQLRRVATALWVDGGEPDLRALDPAPAPAPVAARPATAGGAVTAPAARRGPAVRLDLGGPLVRLGDGAAGLLGRPAAPPPALVPAPAAPAPAASTPAAPTPAAPTPAAPTPAAPTPAAPTPAASAPAAGADALSTLHRLAGRSAVAAELAALLAETAGHATQVLDAAAAAPARPAAARTAAPPRPAPATPAPAAPARPVPAPRRAAAVAPAPPTRPATAPPVTAPPVVASPPPPGRGAAVPGPRPAADDLVLRETLTVSVEAMPYLRDHCFFFQPDDWPEVADRWPVVPATTVVQHMVDAAGRAAPGRRVVAVHDARFTRWLLAAPAVEVPVTVRRAGPDRYAVALAGYARAVVEVADDYPADAPPAWTHDPATEHPPAISAAQMYAERHMFHGPRFQGVTAVHALGERHVRGDVTAPEPPGALLDNALQVIGNWLVTTQPQRTVALPVGFRHIRFYGPPPAPGTVFDCVARIRAIDDRELVADTQLSRGGRVVAQIDGAVDRRFDTDPAARPAERFPDRYALSARHPGGFTVAYDRWTDLVTRGMAAYSVLGGAAYAAYERVPAAQRKQWMLGRVAAKDAVRFRQWDAGHTGLYPIELTVGNDASGRPSVTVPPGRGLVDCDVSLAHTGDAAVALAAPAGSAAPGIDLVEVAPRDAGTLAVALTPAERDLLDSLGGDRDLWFARFWAAKEAVGKSRGTGLDGAPRRFAVTGPDLTVEVDGRTYPVASAEIENPPELPPRRYVVAWTWGPTP